MTLPSAIGSKAFVIGITAFTAVIVAFAGQQTPRPLASSPVTFTRDIAPIVFHSCSSCHHSGEAGPFSLLTYGEVKSHARQIADITSRLLMPPWLPSSDSLPMEDDPHLSAEQIALFQKWVADGLLEG